MGLEVFKVYLGIVFKFGWCNFLFSILILVIYIKCLDLYIVIFDVCWLFVKMVFYSWW